MYCVAVATLMCVNGFEIELFRLQQLMCIWLFHLSSWNLFQSVHLGNGLKSVLFHCGDFDVWNGDGLLKWSFWTLVNLYVIVCLIVQLVNWFFHLSLLFQPFFVKTHTSMITIHVLASLLFLLQCAHIFAWILAVTDYLHFSFSNQPLLFDD